MSDSSEHDFGFGELIDAAVLGDGFDWDDDGLEADGSEEVVSVLRFRVDDSRFAVPTEYVREIIAEIDITALPGAPKHVRGVAMLRRQVLGVIDLGQWLDPVAERQHVGSGRIVIVEVGPYTVGIEVSEVDGMADWPANVLDRSRIPETLNSRTRRYAAGIRLNEHEAIVLLDVPKLLNDAAVQ